jgi:hypothetical protein
MFRACSIIGDSALIIAFYSAGSGVILHVLSNIISVDVYLPSQNICVNMMLARAYMSIK